MENIIANTLQTLSVPCHAIWISQCTGELPDQDEQHPSGILRSERKVYIDDILIDSQTLEEHVILVQKVLQWLREYQMAISLEKSAFHVKKMDFLGYVVGTDSVTMNEKKVE